MTTAHLQTLTIEDVLEAPPQGAWELVRGELIQKMPGSFNHGRVAMNAAMLLASHVKREGLGVILAAETGFVLERDPDTLRAPDVAFVRQDRLPPDLTLGFFDGPPDFAVEVVSPSDRKPEVMAKVEQWLDKGVELVWVVWPRTRSVAVHRRGVDPRMLHEGATLDGEDVVPGFTCPVADFFA